MMKRKIQVKENRTNSTSMLFVVTTFLVSVQFFLGSYAYSIALTALPADQATTVDNVTFVFSHTGPVDQMHCVSVNEPAEPSSHAWQDNYFCTSENIGVRWSVAGEIASMSCTQIREASDPHSWTDNYLCLPKDSRFQFAWYSSNVPNISTKVRWNEPSDPDTWSDNWLSVSLGFVVDEIIIKSFEVEVSTQNYTNANTDGGVDFTYYWLVGELAGMTVNLDNPNYDDFERGETNVFRLEAMKGKKINLNRDAKFRIALPATSNDPWGVRNIRMRINGVGLYDESVNKTLSLDRTFSACGFQVCAPFVDRAFPLSTFLKRKLTSASSWEMLVTNKSQLRAELIQTTISGNEVSRGFLEPGGQLRVETSMNESWKAKINGKVALINGLESLQVNNTTSAHISLKVIK